MLHKSYFGSAVALIEIEGRVASTQVFWEK